MNEFQVPNANQEQTSQDLILTKKFQTKHNTEPFNSKCIQCVEHYQRQCLAFAPIVANSLGQFGTYSLQFLWNLADHQAKYTFGFTIDSPANQ